MTREKELAAEKVDGWKLILGLSRVLAMLSGAVFLGMFVWVVLSRIGYPFELEWCEGAMLDHVYRASQGLSIYGPPSVDYLAPLYTPLYFHVSAGAAKILGPGFLAPRLVSLLSTFAALALVFYWIRREVGDVLPALAGVALFAASIGSTGAWMDLCRVDGLQVVLLGLAAYLLRFAAGRWTFLLAGSLLVLAVATKQSTLPLVLTMVLFVLLRHRRQILVFVSPMVVAALAAVLYNQVHDGWPFFYTVAMPGAHHLHGSLFRFWGVDLFGVMPIAIVLSLSVLGHWALRQKSREVLFYVLLLAGVLATSYLPRSKVGGFQNNLMPTYLILAILFGVALGLVRPKLLPLEPRTRSALASLWFFVITAQLGILTYDPRTQVPDSGDRQAGEEMVRQIAALEGEVYLPAHGYLGVLAGKQSYAFEMAVFDVLSSRSEKAKALFLDDLDSALRRRFQAVIGKVSHTLPLSHYGFDGPETIINGPHFYPVTGSRRRPEELWLKSPPSVEPGGAE